MSRNNQNLHFCDTQTHSGARDSGNIVSTDYLAGLASEGGRAYYPACYETT